jgi:GPH family glycoside/pentoside/hexuronide:cation symporter
MGDVGTGMGAALIGFYLLLFYTAAGLPPWQAGLAYGGGRLWDAVNDPIVGWLSDKTNSPRWGPRLPWILWSAVPLGFAMAAMWWLPPWPDAWVKFWIFLTISIIANNLYTCVNLPYSALAAELTTDVSLRTRLNTARFTGSILATLVASVLAGLLVKDLHDPSSYLPVGLVSGLIITVTTLICGWGLVPSARNCQRPDSPKGTTRRLLSRVVHNGRFMRVLGLYLLLWCALQLMQAVALFYLPMVLQVPEGWSRWILLPFLVSTLVGLWLWNRFSHRRGRLAALHLGSGLWIAGCLAVLVLPPWIPPLVPPAPGPTWSSLIALLTTIITAGIGASTAYLIPWSLLPDAIDADPEKPAGQYSAWMVLAQKVCISGVMVGYGGLLSLSGYEQTLGTTQPSSALVTIRLCMGLIPAVLVVLGLVVMRHWPRRTLPHPPNPPPADARPSPAAARPTPSQGASWRPARRQAAPGPCRAGSGPAGCGGWAAAC